MVIATTPAMARWESVDFSAVRSAADCDAMISRNPGVFSSYYCYDVVARRVGAWEEMARHLEGKLSLEPGNLALRVALGFIEDDRGDERAIRLFEEAAQGFSSKGDAGSECLTRIELANLTTRLGDFDRAIRGYQQVIAVWPVQADWRIQFRLARCLAKTGDERASETTRLRAKEVELLMEEKVHSPLRTMLKSPDQLEICERMTQFYEQLGLEFEAQQWRDQLARQPRKNERSKISRTP